MAVRSLLAESPRYVGLATKRAPYVARTMARQLSKDHKNQRPLYPLLATEPRLMQPLPHLQNLYGLKSDEVLASATVRLPFSAPKRCYVSSIASRPTPPIAPVIHKLYYNDSIVIAAVHGSNNQNISCILQTGIKIDLYFKVVELAPLRKGKTLLEFQTALLAHSKVKESAAYATNHVDLSKNTCPALLFFANPPIDWCDAFSTSPIRIHENIAEFYYVRGCRDVKPLGSCQIDGSEMPIIPNATPNRREGTTAATGQFMVWGVLGGVAGAIFILKEIILVLEKMT